MNIEKIKQTFPPLIDHVMDRKVFLFSIAIALGLIGVFLELTSEMLEEESVALIDGRIITFVATFRHNTLNGMAVDLTALGSFTVLTIFTILGMLILHFLKNHKGALYLILGSAGSAVLSTLMKNFFSRERPTEVEKLVEVSSYSYPSGHSLSASAFYLLIAFLVFTSFEKLKDRMLIFLFFITLILGIGGSRIYLGVHYPSDVMAGILLGSAWTFLLTAIFYGRRNS